MKLTVSILSIFFCLSATNLFGQGILFEKENWQAVLKKAQDEEKIIFLDAYTSWCGPCKQMSAYVFPDPALGEYHNDNFINVKIDMEKGDGIQLASKYNVRMYPTLLYIDHNGKVIRKRAGMLRADKLLELSKSVLRKQTNIDDLKAKYDAGERDLDLLANYAHGLKVKGEPYLAVTNEFLRQPNANKHYKYLETLYRLTPSLDASAFKHFKKNISQLNTKYGQSTIQQKLLTLHQKTVQKAIKYQSAELLETAHSTLNELYIDKTTLTDYISLGNCQYYSQAEPNFNQYKKSSKSYLSSERDNEEIFTVLESLVTIFNTKSSGKYGVSYSAQLVEKGKKAKFYFLHAQLLRLNGENELAKEFGKKALEKSKRNSVLQKNITEWIDG